jgi:enoyl-CoA hydratase/carnithine racemase
VLNQRTLGEFHAQLAAAERLGRPVVLTGADGVFCTGMDLAEVEDGFGSAKRALLSFADCLLSIRWAPVPTIAAVDGSVLGGGLGIAAACDLTLATAHSSFGLPEALFGLIPAVVMPLLLERVSPQQARLLALRGSTVTAERAFTMGLVDQVVESSDLLEAETRRGVRELSRVPVQAIASLKQLSETAGGCLLDEALCAGAGVTARLLQTSDVRRTIHAFLADGTQPWEAR